MKKYFYIYALVLSAAMTLTSCYEFSNPEIFDKVKSVKLEITPTFYGSLPDVVDVESIIVDINGVKKTLVYQGKDTTYNIVIDVPADITYHMVYRANTKTKVNTEKKYSCLSYISCDYKTVGKPVNISGSTCLYFFRDYVNGDQVADWIANGNKGNEKGHFTINEDGEITIINGYPETQSLSKAEFNDILSVDVDASALVAGSLFSVVDVEMVCKQANGTEKVIPCVNNKANWITRYDECDYPVKIAFGLRYKIKPDAIIMDDENYDYSTSCVYKTVTTHFKRDKETKSYTRGLSNYSPLKGSAIKKWIEAENAEEPRNYLSIDSDGKVTYGKSDLN